MSNDHKYILIEQDPQNQQINVLKAKIGMYRTRSFDTNNIFTTSIFNIKQFFDDHKEININKIIPIGSVAFIERFLKILNNKKYLERHTYLYASTYYREMYPHKIEERYKYGIINEMKNNNGGVISLYSHENETYIFPDWTPELNTILEKNLIDNMIYYYSKYFKVHGYTEVIIKEKDILAVNSYPRFNSTKDYSMPGSKSLYRIIDKFATLNATITKKPVYSVLIVTVETEPEKYEDFLWRINHPCYLPPIIPEINYFNLWARHFTETLSR